MKNFRDLKVWEKAHQLTLSAYKVSKGFPKEELYGLTNQMRRSAASIPANIAEGCGRGGDPELARFFQKALGSASEFEYHVLLGRDFGLIKSQDYEHLTNCVTEVKKCLRYS